MNDRSKFRVWHTQAKKFTKDELNFRMCLDTQGNLFWSEDGGGDCEDLLKSEFVINRCIGLKDKNGKLIYEGDIVKGHGKFTGQSEVFWDTNTMSYHPFTYLNDFEGKNYEVIGNKHNNVLIPNRNPKKSGFKVTTEGNNGL